LAGCLVDRRLDAADVGDVLASYRRGAGDGTTPRGWICGRPGEGHRGGLGGEAVWWQAATLGRPRVSGRAIAGSRGRGRLGQGTGGGGQGLSEKSEREGLHGLARG
jgi:hypothetical protein